MNTLTTSQAIALFELIHCPWKKIFVVAPPSEASIRNINAELGIQLPPSMIAFAKQCSSYGAWFAGLGEDYSNPFHILTINRIFGSSSGGHKALIPNWLVIINHGHDGDCDCLDTRNYNPITGEYPIIYWSVEDGTTCEISKPDCDFSAFLETMLFQSMENLNPSDKREAEKILFGS